MKFLKPYLNVVSVGKSALNRVEEISHHITRNRPFLIIMNLCKKSSAATLITSKAKIHFIINNSQENSLWLQTFLSFFSTWINGNDFISFAKLQFHLFPIGRKWLKCCRQKLCAIKLFNFFLKRHTHTKKTVFQLHFFFILFLFFLLKRHKKINWKFMSKENVAAFCSTKTKRQYFYVLWICSNRHCKQIVLLD